MSDRAPNVLDLNAPESVDAALSGGKGSNLAQLVQAGFPVPPGIVVTTEAYRLFVEGGGLSERLMAALSGVDYDDAGRLEEATASLREMIEAASMPDEIEAPLREGYAALGGDVYVAVRSSGTAEDMADASFAGLHDTYLDIRSGDGVVDAVKRCWASMWTARATSYRNTKGIDQGSVAIAVVVQKMVDAETAGVLFTVNPMTESVEEIVINSSWGLGEAIVSGITTPDYFVLSAADLAVKSRTLGSKDVQIVRNPETGIGTVTEAVSDEAQKRFSLDDRALTEIGDIGRRVSAHYGGLPQDIEWAYADGQAYLLQSRPVTGIEISWDSEVDSWQRLPESDDIVWTRSWADEQWTGAITPLFYSWRAEMFTRAYSHCAELWGVPEMATERMFKFHKAEAYFNVGLERAIIEHTVFPVFRAGPNALNHVPPAWHGEILDSPFSLLRYLKMHGRIVAAGDPANTPYAFLRAFHNYFYNRAEEADGLSREALTRLSDDALERYVDDCIEFEIEFAKDLWSGYYLYARDAFGALGWMLANWYDGDNPLAFGELLSGTPQRTATLQENLELFELAGKIRNSPSLLETFGNHEGAAFFAELENSDEGREFLSEYEEFAAKNWHRGHAERDVYFPRRDEEPAMDYRAWKALLSSDAPDPEASERQVNARRQEVIDEVVENIKGRPFGSLRAEVFKTVLDWTLKFLVVRDDERYLVDRSTYAAKRGFQEMGRRMIERGLLDTERDIYFLSRDELRRLLRREQTTPLFRGKIAARMRDFDRFLNHEGKPPLYLQANEAVDLELAGESGDEPGRFSGIGTSHGKVTGRARVLREVGEIDRVEKGDILVTNHTDPGWTPVFLVIGGIVLETGGMLAHGSLLAREYGFPAVQVANATQLVSDGALITVDGDTGQLILEEDGDAGEDDTKAIASTSEA